ncbi:MAG: molybdopterin converting factor subunit 1 [Gammaproteobacteria bacterium]|nr:molybdopterin converting factor subunit 1 [Gammaproteobacteria bacterium]
MIDILYFARFRERLGVEREQVALSTPQQTVAMLMAELAERGDNWADIFKGTHQVLVAVNQEIVKPDSELNDGDEVGFFPPVTGG